MVGGSDDGRRVRRRRANDAAFAVGAAAFLQRGVLLHAALMRQRRDRAITQHDRRQHCCQYGRRQQSLCEQGSHPQSLYRRRCTCRL